ncbi:MAG: hypothetical protein QXU52_00995 [Fervidicoccaceae archaeon]
MWKRDGALYALYSGSHPCLSMAELLSFFDEEEILLELTQFVALRTSPERAVMAQRLSATIKEVGELLCIGELERREDVGSLLEECLREPPTIGVTLSLRTLGSASAIPTGEEILREAARFIEGRWGVRVRLGGRGRAGAIRIALVDGLMALGRVLSSESKGALLLENPHELPCYRPGALNAWFARLLFNLASRNQVSKFADFFCGVGTIARQAIGASLYVLCGELRRDYAECAKLNAGSEREANCDVVRWDARSPPLRGEAIEAVASDLPYGRSTRGPNCEEELARRFIELLPLLLKRGGRAVIVTPMEWRLPRRGEGGLALWRRCPMYVHSALTRQITVYERE